MSETRILAPFFKWGIFKSNNSDAPDVLELRVLEAEIFETEYSTNTRVQIKEGKNWIDVVLPLKSHGSNNAGLLNQWTELLKKSRIKAGQQLKIKTWLGVTKLTQRPIRRFAISIG